MIAEIFKTLLAVHGGSDGDWIDRLNYKVTSLALIILAVLVSTKQYVGDPINCWCPAHFTKDWVDYTNNVCWISNTYFLAMSVPVETGKNFKMEKEVPYYQWIPLILSMQALMFYFPRLIWRYSYQATGIDLDGLVVSLSNFDTIVSPDSRDKMFLFLAKYMDKYLTSQRVAHPYTICSRLRLCISSHFFLLCSHKFGNILSGIYLMIKLIYSFNVCLQLFFLNLWMGPGYYSYGLNVLSDVIRHVDWTDTWRFPRITLCDFQIRTLGNVQSFTVQCVLSINLFNEKIYLFIWFWLVFVGMATILNFLEWIVRTICFNDRLSYIKKHLKYMDRYNTPEDKKLCKRFVNLYLRPDGVFMIRLLSKNTNSIIVSELVAQLWDNYISKPHHQHPLTNMPGNYSVLPQGHASQGPSGPASHNKLATSSGSAYGAPPPPGSIAAMAAKSKQGGLDTSSSKKSNLTPYPSSTDAPYVGHPTMTYQRRLGSPDGSIVDV